MVRYDIPPLYASVPGKQGHLLILQTIVFAPTKISYMYNSLPGIFYIMILRKPRSRIVYYYSFTDPCLYIKFGHCSTRLIDRNIFRSSVAHDVSDIDL